MSLTPNNDYFAARPQPDHLEVTWSPTAVWQLGGELNYRQAKGRGDDSVAQSVGLRFTYGKTFGPGRFYAGMAGGYLRLNIDRTAMVGAASVNARDSSEGYYLTPLLGYSVPLGEQFSLALEYQHAVERVADFHSGSIPANSATNLNSGGLNNIIYNPYAGLDVYRNVNRP